ncbi:MAG: aldo/keto reductase [Candidatus Methanomethylophilus sp.]|nr:aldo/keto reductase [Methanomethylophilus sp.]
MIYRDYQGDRLSMMGFGAMRLPVIDGNDGKVDVTKAEALVDEAYRSGINYFDTAWGYHMGTSETVMGEALSRYPRDSYRLSTKFPGYDLSNFGKHEEIFAKQLEKCKVDYFDFYFLHNVCELNIDRYMDEEKYHTVSFFRRMKAEGKIKHLGFSCHGSLEVMKRFLEKYGEFMEFGMIQMNYLDYNFQGAKGKLDLLNSYRIPVWVMEPLRGGMLAKMAPADLERMRKTRPGIEPVELAFRFLQSLPGVTVILSGMTEMEQMREKLRIFEKDEPLSKDETDALLDIAKGLINGKVAPCTACKYCLSHCPKELNIPVLLEKYNEDALTGGGFIAPFAIKALPPEKRPSACIGCKSCEKVCPQQIRISEILKAFGSKMDGMLEAFFGKEA